MDKNIGGRKMKITGKLLLSYATLVLIMVLSGVVAVNGLLQVNNNAKSLYYERVEPLQDMNKIVKLAENTRVNMMSAVLNEDVSKTEIATNNLKEIASLMDEYEQIPLNEKEKAVYQNFKENWIAFTEVVQSNINLIQNAEYDMAREGLIAGGEYYEPASEYLTSLMGETEKAIQTYNQENFASFKANRNIIIITIVVAAIVAMLLSLKMGRYIGKPLNKITLHIQDFANGDLSGVMEETKRKDEIGELTNAANQMKHHLSQLIQKASNVSTNVVAQSDVLSQSANEVTEGSKQIATTMEELADGAEAQAHGATSLSEKMERLLSHIHDADKSTLETVSDAEMVLNHADNGKQALQESVEQMNEIHELVGVAVNKVKELDQDSKEISSLVTVIEGIAEQTNLLALNAAIEAARAGEQGKGFLVVADEVRKLAEGVSKSIGQVTALTQKIQVGSSNVAEALQSSYEEVEKGSIHLGETGVIFDEVNQSVTKIVHQIQQVSEELNRVVKESGEISGTIQEIASVSEESAAGVEETAASCEQSLSSMEEVLTSAADLQKLAKELEKEMQRFKV